MRNISAQIDWGANSKDDHLSRLYALLKKTQ